LSGRAAAFKRSAGAMLQGGTPGLLSMDRWICAALTVCLLVAASPTRAQHACDRIEDPGWRVVASNEVTGVKDGIPYRAGGDWVVDRTTTLLPLCNYFNAVGNYSLRSYSLEPTQTTERVVICRGGAAVAPYSGPCPPN
jgi:hypothetical protein